MLYQLHGAIDLWLIMYCRNVVLRIVLVTGVEILEPRRRGSHRSLRAPFGNMFNSVVIFLV